MFLLEFEGLIRVIRLLFFSFRLILVRIFMFL